MSDLSTRRDFLKRAAAATAGAAIPGGLTGAAHSADGPTSRLVVVRDPKVLAESDAPGGKVDTAVLASMLDRAVAKAVGKSEAAAAWKSLFKPDDVVGIKVNCLFGPGVSTRPELADAAAAALMRAGVKPENIIIWDRSTGDLLKSGYKINKSPGKPQVLANDGEWEEKATTSGSFKGRLTKILTQQITAMINMPIMKDHGISGVSGALKNHYGTHDNPGRHHPNNCNPFLADLNAIPAIKDKTRLVVMDALRPQANGGPGLKRDMLWDLYSLVVSTDPVAVDYFAWQTIDERRKAIGMKTLAESGREPKWIATAAGMKLGVNDPARMDLIKLG